MFSLNLIPITNIPTKDPLEPCIPAKLEGTHVNIFTSETYPHRYNAVLLSLPSVTVIYTTERLTCISRRDCGITAGSVESRSRVPPVSSQTVITLINRSVTNLRLCKDTVCARASAVRTKQTLTVSWPLQFEVNSLNCWHVLCSKCPTSLRHLNVLIPYNLLSFLI